MTPATGPVVLMVSVEVAEPLAAGVTEVGLSEQLGAIDGVGDTEQVSATELPNWNRDPTVTLAVADCPAGNGFGSGTIFETEKSGPFSVCFKSTLVCF